MLRYLLPVMLLGSALWPAQSASAAGAPEAAAPSAEAAYKRAVQLVTEGDYDAALALIGKALEAAPADLELLQLRASVLLELRDFAGALSAYEAFLQAGATGANKRAAEKIVANLRASATTFLHVKITNGPAKVYLDSKSLGVFCVADGECKRGMLAGSYKVIIEREGHERLTERIEIATDQVLTLERTLVEKPSAVSLTTAPAGGVVTVDGKELGPAPVQTTLPPGEHQLEVRLGGHVTHRQAFSAREGKPVEVAIGLLATVPIQVPVVGAQLLLDGKAARIEDGALVLPGPGAHELTVRAPRHREARVQIPAERPVGYRVEVKLEPALARLQVDGAPSGAVVMVDGKAVGTTPLVAPVELEPGQHTVEVHARGFAPFRGSTTLDPDMTKSVRMKHLQRTGQRKAWIAASVSGVLLAGTVFAGLKARDLEVSFDERSEMQGITVDDPMLQSYGDRGRSWALATDVGLGLTAVGAGLATWLFMTEGKGESRASFEPIIGPTGVGVTGRF